MTKPDVLILSPLAWRQMEQLESAYRLHRLDMLKDDAREAMIDTAGPLCTAMVLSGHITVDRALLDRLPAMKMAACSSAGFDQIDLAELTARGIRMTNTSPALLDDVADTAVMLMLAARRRLVTGDAWVRSGDWARKGMMPLSTSLAGKRVGIVGLGNIGQAIAQRCAPFGLQIGYTGRNPKPGVSYPYFDTPLALATWADIMIIATPGGAETRGIISAKVLEALGRDGTLINIARGSVVDEPALIAALQGGGLGSAGLDVFASEPNPDPALTALENVVLYPHHASGTEETRDRMAQLTADNLRAFFAGEALLTPVN